jgi:hypothetical protein
VINSNDIDGVFVLFDEVKGFLLLFKIFMGFFVKEIIKDFCQRQQTIAGFLGVGFLGDF